LSDAAPRAVLSTMHHASVLFGWYADPVFVFFSNRLGCLGSIAVSIVGTALLVMLMRSCA
jgi:hypothetical protein